jgi:hypothetical protein
VKLSEGKARLFWLLSGLRIIGKTILVIMVLSSTIVKAESPSSPYYIDKQALDNAKSAGTVAAVDNFIQQHPNSAWLDNATYYRDKQALDDAKSKGTVDAIDDFIQQYPTSVWLNNAIHTRDKKVYNHAKKAGTRAEFEDFLRKYPDSKWKQKVEKKLTALSKKESMHIPDGKQTAKKHMLLSSNERVSRALAIHEAINKENSKKAAKKELQLAKLQKQKSRCYVLKDKVRQYGERRLWYALGDTGNRTYLTDEEVAEKRRDIESDFAEKCNKFKL